MKKKLKNYRIVSDKGKSLLLTRERYHHLLATLDALANGASDRPERQSYPNKS